MHVLSCLSWLCICIPAHVQHLCSFMYYYSTDVCTSVSMHLSFVCDCACIHSHCHADPLFPLPPSLGLYELLAALPSQLQPHVSRPEDNTFLQDMFGERSLQSLVKVKQKQKKPIFFQVMCAVLLCDSVKMFFRCWYPCCFCHCSCQTANSYPSQLRHLSPL